MKYLYLIIISLLTLPVAAQEWQFSGQAPTLEEARQWQQQAADNDKDLMLVLGATWCHDSTALLEQFNQTQFREKLKQQYQVQIVDISYFERGYNLVQAYGEPIYYGTPTVMIIDGDSGNIKNFASWQHWTNASRHSAEEFEAYFIGKNFLTMTDEKLSEEHRQKLLAFKQQQAKRIKAGYMWVAPHLKAYKKSAAKQPPQSFIEKWMAVAKFRNQVHADIVAAYKKALAAPSKALELPSYDKKSWES
ncbi:MAG: hypothetical protein ACQEQ8_04820 [Pseudomonadota bacterium]